MLAEPQGNKGVPGTANGSPARRMESFTSHCGLIYSFGLLAAYGLLTSAARIHPKEDFHGWHLSSRSALFGSSAFRIFSGGPFGLGARGGAACRRSAGFGRGAGSCGVARATTL